MHVYVAFHSVGPTTSRVHPDAGVLPGVDPIILVVWERRTDPVIVSPEADVISRGFIDTSWVVYQRFVEVPVLNSPHHHAELDVIRLIVIGVISRSQIGICLTLCSPLASDDWLARGRISI